MRNLFVIVILLVLVLAGISELNSGEEPKTLEKTTVEIDAKELDKEVEKILNDMTIEERVGQMIMAGIDGEDITEDSRFLLEEYHIGGVILFDRNMKNPEQVKNLITRLKEAGEGKVPMFFATDEEGGESARLKGHITTPASAKSLAEGGDTEKAYEEMKAAAGELKELGFNMNFAPVADLNLPNNRAYSTDANITGAFVKSAAKGVYDGGLIPVVKHFPGLGSVQYLPAPVVKKKKLELSATDLYPYQILKEVDFPYFIMVNNAVYTDIDSNPASISRAVVKKILRDELQYQGVIITDDLSTGNVLTPGERAAKAIEAGADIVLSCNKYEDTRVMYLAILDAYNHDKISYNRIEESVKRILKAKLLLKHLEANK